MHVKAAFGVVNFLLAAAVAFLPATADENPVALLAGLGAWTHPITTGNPEAQKFFDQGLNLAYGFNRYEALRSFRKAAVRQTAPETLASDSATNLSLGEVYPGKDKCNKNSVTLPHPACHVLRSIKISRNGFVVVTAREPLSVKKSRSQRSYGVAFIACALPFTIFACTYVN
jgi:hypothetical protein